MLWKRTWNANSQGKYAGSSVHVTVSTLILNSAESICYVLYPESNGIFFLGCTNEATVELCFE